RWRTGSRCAWRHRADVSAGHDSQGNRRRPTVAGDDRRPAGTTAWHCRAHRRHLRSPHHSFGHARQRDREGTGYHMGAELQEAPVMRHSIVVAVVGIAFAIPGVARTQAAKATDSVVVHVSNTDLRSAVQMIQAYLDKPVIFSGSTAGPQVSLETPHPVPRSEIPMLLRGLLDSQGYELVDDSATRTYRARPKEVIRSPNIVQQQMGAAGPAAADATRRQTTAPELFVLP